MKLSIIVPVYNVEQYIRSCVQSIYKQGLSEDDFEVILVNDGTQDNSFDVIGDIIAHHTNIIILEQSNQGLSAARNAGLSRAIGEFVLFLDSDDMLIDNKISDILDQAINQSADMTIADFIKLSDDDILLDNIPDPNLKPYTIMSGKDYFLNSFNPQQCYVWRTIYKRKFLNDNNLRFVPNIYFEDVPFTTECYLKAKNCLIVPVCFYVYRQHSNSIVSSVNMRKVMDFNIVISCLWRMFEDYCLSKELKNKLMDTVFVTFSIATWYVIHDKELLYKRKEFISDLKCKVPELRFTHGVKQRIISLLFNLMPATYLRIRSIC